MIWKRIRNVFINLYTWIEEKLLLIKLSIKKSIILTSLFVIISPLVSDTLRSYLVVIKDELFGKSSVSKKIEGKMESVATKKENISVFKDSNESTGLSVDKNLVANIKYYWKIKIDIEVQQIKWVSVNSKDFYDMFIVYYTYGGDGPDEGFLDKVSVVDIFKYDETEKTGLKNLKHIVNQEDFYNISIMENKNGIAFVVENLSSGSYGNGFLEIYELIGSEVVLKYQSKYLNYSEFVIVKNEILIKGSGTKFKVMKEGKKYREVNIPNTKLKDLKNNEHLLVLKCNKLTNKEEFIYDNKKIEFKNNSDVYYVSLKSLNIFYNDVVIYEQENCKSLRIKSFASGDSLDFMESFKDKILAVDSGSGELSVKIGDEREYQIEFKVDKNAITNSPEDT